MYCHKKIGIEFWFSVCMLLPLVSLRAYEDPSFCLKELETHFFSYDLLVEALSMSGIAQSQWTLIYQELKNRKKRIADGVRESARHMQPNPLDHPFDSEQAEKILTTVSFSEFDAVMRTFNVSNPLLIRSTFDYIKSRQAKRFKACLESHLPSLKQKSFLNY